MKKSKINPDEILKDLNSLLDFADMVDELDSSNINKEKLEEQAKKLENKGIILRSMENYKMKNKLRMTIGSTAQNKKFIKEIKNILR